MPTRFKPIDIRPMMQPLDARSSADELEFGSWRYLLNIAALTKNKICRATGFRRNLDRDNYNNQDLHDQLLSKTGVPDRLPITFLFQADSTRKGTKLLAGTKEAIYALNNATGNWKIIWDKLDSENRVRAASLGDVVILSNNDDGIKYWNYDSGIIEPDDQSVSDIPELATDIKLTKAGVVLVWKDVVFLMNVVIEGTVQTHAIYWSNYQKPLEWLPAEGSAAGSRELDLDETILGALPLANKLLIYTNKAIWEGTVANAALVFSIVKRYDPTAGEACLFYPNTLISTGDRHVYAAKDGIYVYSLYEEKPVRVAWMHQASSIMYDNFDPDNCNVHVAGYNTDLKEIYFSFAKPGESVPSETLVFHTEQPYAYVIDHGFSTFVTYTAKEPTQILRNFLLEYGICLPDEFEEHFGGFTKEGEIPVCASDVWVDDEGNIVENDEGNGGVLV